MCDTWPRRRGPKTDHTVSLVQLYDADGPTLGIHAYYGRKTACGLDTGECDTHTCRPGWKGNNTPEGVTCPECQKLQG